ncbi:rod shape-determining protein [Nitratidesulfovibrio vulgaris]|jgi:rod shape-determining protein MreB|uniref:Cell shape-determining protein MreB n=2 Tax=Nitratidesulfovibrio vulgaris TaxID=881 RepID=Q72BF5_NITV2|nr:rod shape-determining protein [Nitratidesulfovibrio vulgaris]GEB79412.1 rod shape-determining protein [Desulfovibrio desulfuricans]HBW14601.1 rod shape-determining protein [Desulfovibrio sp.]AAS96158.1 rod shape-determining protein MreB [Nitratidesulfovibrio vulgaris str. Hildenborough]ABM28424.1 rod shape-determining protein MreB [Nitratidesulfovibrio vulgaris DP4]ADP86764.1 cell shape determining protein, MreB/Mrl family [Nitratidesulfovibrio vulgaris RCH1]
MLRKLFGFLGKDLAMDLGTANTLLFTRADGIVLNEPSVVAIETERNSVLAVGREAKEYLGRTPQRIRAIRPMKDGVIADFEVTRQMIEFFIRKVIKGFNIVKPGIVICVPTGITQVEKRAVIESATQAGARDVRLVEEPMAAAIGANLPIHEPLGSMVVDIGGGTTEVAVISLSAIAYAESVRMAGDAMNHAIQRYFQEEFQLLIGENMSERIKMSIGSAFPLPEQLLMEVSGKDMLTGTPKVVRVSDGHIREALREPVRVILTAIRRALEKTPPELAGDIARNGLLLAGGGSLLKGLDALVARETRLKVIIDEDPLTTVVRGTGRTLDDRKFFSRVYIN